MNSDHEPLAIEMLVKSHHLHVTVDDDAKARQLEAIANPAFDRPAAMRRESDVDRVLSILDELERGAHDD